MELTIASLMASRSRGSVEHRKRPAHLVRAKALQQGHQAAGLRRWSLFRVRGPGVTWCKFASQIRLYSLVSRIRQERFFLNERCLVVTGSGTLASLLVVNPNRQALRQSPRDSEMVFLQNLPLTQSLRYLFSCSSETTHGKFAMPWPSRLLPWRTRPPVRVRRAWSAVRDDDWGLQCVNLEEDGIEALLSIKSSVPMTCVQGGARTGTS